MELNANSTPAQPMMEDSRVRRNIIVRILFSLLWLLPVIYGIFAIVGAVLGAVAGYNAGTMDQPTDAAHESARQFFENYRGKMLFMSVVVWMGLSIIGVLPGTSKFKRTKAKRSAHS